MSLNNYDEAIHSSSEEERMLMEDGEDLDGPKELSIDNIRGMKASIEKNVKDLEEALAEVTTSNEATNHELIKELNLALVQSNLLLEKIVIIEDGYKKAIKTDTLLSQEIIDLSEQLGFIVPLHLTTTIEEISESVSPNTHNNNEEDTGLEVREGDYKFVSFDELEKYLNEPLLPEERNQKEKTPQRAAISNISTPNIASTISSPKVIKSPPQQPSPMESVGDEPVTPDITSKDKELRKEYLKNSINMSKVSFSSPTSTASFFSTPAVEKSDRKNLEGDDYIEMTPIVEEENPALTEEQQQLIEEQDVNNLLEQLMIYTNGLDEAKNSPRNRPMGDLLKDIKEEESTPQENVSSPSIFLRQDGNASPHYSRVTPRDTPREIPREIQKEPQKEIVKEEPRVVVESPPKLSATNLENEFMKRDLEDANAQISFLKQQVESLQDQVESTEAENFELKTTIETLRQAKNQFDADIQSIKEKEEKINLIASSLGDHIEFLQGMVDKLKSERDNKVIKQSEQLTTIIETLIRKENSLLETVVNQMESEMNNRKVVLDEEMLKLKKIVVECLGDEDDNSGKDFNPEALQALQSELQRVADELSEINYFPSDPDDDIDNAVTRTLESLECPVTIEIERIGYGEYYLDRKLYIKLGPKGEPLVKNGNSFITLTSYVKRLYAPFFTTEKHLKEEEQLEIETQALQSSKFESLLQKLSKTRDYINNLHTSTRSGSDSPPASPPRRSSPLRNNTTLNLSQLNNSGESSNASTKLSPREGPKLTQKKDPQQEDQNKEGRPSSAPPNTRYINILQRAEKNKKLKPIKPTPQVRRPPPNSMTFDRRNSPLPPNYVMHNNNLLFVKQPSNYEQVLAAHQSVKKPIVPQKSASTNNSRASSPRNHPQQQQQQPQPQQTIKSTMFGSIDLGDPKQLEKLKKQALRMQIQQFSQKPFN